MESITHAKGSNASTRTLNRVAHASSEPASNQMRGFHSNPHRALFATQPTVEDQEPNTLLMDDATLAQGFVLLPKLILYARHLSRDAKLLYAVLLGYAWQEQRCWPGYMRLCADLDASENAVRKWMRELENAHLLSQRRRGLGLSNLYTLHDLRTAKIEVQDPHKTEGLEPQKSEDYEEPREEETQEEKDRSIGERPVRKSAEHPENDEKALVGGVPAASAQVLPVNPPLPTVLQRPTPTRGKQRKDQQASPRVQALAQAKEEAGAAIEEQLRALGGAHPAGGVERILEALVDAQIPVAVMGALLEVGERRLAQQQEREHIPNPTGYLISIMRNLAVEAWLKGWNLAQIQAEDEEKHAQARRRRGCAEQGVQEPAVEEAPAEASGAGETPMSEEAEMGPADLPEGMEFIDEAGLEALYDTIPDPDTGQLRSLTMLWGFVRQALWDHLNLPRRQHLDHLTPRWDAARPRTLLLLSTTRYTGRFVAQVMGVDIERQIEKLLSAYFDGFQVAYAPASEEG